MKDRFLFRAKANNKNGDFVIGFLTSMWGQLHIISVDDENTAYPVIENTIEQCTGLKDKNGKLIFEGDIVTTLSEGCKIDSTGKIAFGEYYSVIKDDSCKYGFFIDWGYS